METDEPSQEEYEAYIETCKQMHDVVCREVPKPLIDKHLPSIKAAFQKLSNLTAVSNRIMQTDFPGEEPGEQHTDPMRAHPDFKACREDMLQAMKTALAGFTADGGSPEQWNCLAEAVHMWSFGAPPPPRPGA